MPPVVRRAPLLERINSLINPVDFIIWLLEECHDEALDESLREWTVPIALSMNLLAMVSRAYSQREMSSDLFDDTEAPGMGRRLSWLVSRATCDVSRSP